MLARKVITSQKMIFLRNDSVMIDFLRRLAAPAKILPEHPFFGKFESEQQLNNVNEQ